MVAVLARGYMRGCGKQQRSSCGIRSSSGGGGGRGGSNISNAAGCLGSLVALNVCLVHRRLPQRKPQSQGIPLQATVKRSPTTGEGGTPQCAVCPSQPPENCTLTVAYPKPT